jgi:pimeloyl-ACP methyl ester carboxylesterase
MRNLSLFAVFIVALAGCVSRPAVPENVIKDSKMIQSGAGRIPVDFYRPRNSRPAPVVVVVHGFLGRKENMAHWGVALSEAGMIAVVPTMPALVDPARNARAVVELTESARSARLPVAARSSGKVALVGFSKGGLETLMAAAMLKPPVNAWVGLDPVDRHGQGQIAAAGVRVPGLALLAEASALNDNGNARQLLSMFGGRLRQVSVKGADHLDAESPRGGPDNEMFAIFRRETLDFLQSELGLSSPANVTTIAPRKSPSAKPVASSSG